MRESCSECGGTGKQEGGEDCMTCEGTGYEYAANDEGEDDKDAADQ